MVTSKRDELSGAPTTIDYVHHEIHEGDMYQVSVSSTALANDGWLALATPNPCAGQMHFTFNAALDGTCQVELLEVDADVGGTRMRQHEHLTGSRALALDVGHSL